MRRDHFTLSAENLAPEAAEAPTLTVSYSGPPGTLTAQLDAETTALSSGDDFDATYRLLPDDDPDGTGVFALSRRLTGDFVLETNGDAEQLFALVDAAREGDDTVYRIRIERSGAEDIVLDKETLLVYDEDGSLLRQHSLIPSGVEL